MAGEKKCSPITIHSMVVSHMPLKPRIECNYAKAKVTGELPVVGEGKNGITEHTSEGILGSHAAGTSPGTGPPKTGK